MKADASWRNGYLTVSIIQFCLVFFIFLVLPLWKRTEQSLQVQILEENPVTEHESFQTTKKKFFIYSIKGVKPTLLAFFFYCAIESTLGLWGSSYLVESRGIKESTAAGWIALFYGGITLGRFINGFLTLRLGNKTLIRLGQIIIVVGTILILLPLPNVFLLSGLVLAGLGCAPIYPCMLHETPSRADKDNVSKLMGIQMAVAYSSFTFLPPLFGFITTHTTMVIYPYVILAYAFFNIISSERVNRIKSKESSKIHTN
jgi:fucose permease